MKDKNGSILKVNDFLKSNQGLVMQIVNLKGKVYLRDRETDETLLLNEVDLSLWVKV